MSEIISGVRDSMRFENTSSMNANDILKRFSKSHLSTMKVSKEELMETLQHYNKLSVIYLDQDENVAFL